MPKSLPPELWRTDPHGRWIDAANHFGRHLMEAACDYAFERIPESADPITTAVARQAALDAIYGTLMLFDGVACSGSVTYTLNAEIQEGRAFGTREKIELAPGGDGLCMGFQGWLEDRLP